VCYNFCSGNCGILVTFEWCLHCTLTCTSFGGLLDPTYLVCYHGCSWNCYFEMVPSRLVDFYFTTFWLGGFLNSIGTDWLWFGFWVPGHWQQHACLRMDYELLLTAFSGLHAFQQSKFTKYDLLLERMLTLIYTLYLFLNRTSAWSTSIMYLLWMTSSEGGKSVGCVYLLSGSVSLVDGCMTTKVCIYWCCSTDMSRWTVSSPYDSDKDG
jgi:hypothetical protein